MGKDCGEHLLVPEDKVFGDRPTLLRVALEHRHYQVDDFGIANVLQHVCPRIIHTLFIVLELSQIK